MCSHSEDSVSPYADLWCFSFRPQKPPALLIFIDGGGETHMCGQSLQLRCLPWGGFFLQSLCIIQANSSGYLVFSPFILSRPPLTSLIWLFSSLPTLSPLFVLLIFSSNAVFSHLCSCCDAFVHIFNLWVFNQVHLCRTVAVAILYLGPCYYLLDV